MHLRLEKWQRVKQTLDPQERFQSDFSRQLQLTDVS
jgi:hypothetical protein